MSTLPLIWEFLNTDIRPHHVDGIRRSVIACLREKQGKCPDIKTVLWYVNRSYEAILILAIATYILVSTLTAYAVDAAIVQLAESRTRTSEIVGSNPRHGYLSLVKSESLGMGKPTLLETK